MQGASRRNAKRLQIRDWPDFLSGVLFGGIGLFIFVHTQQYDMGTAARMGPGYLPMILSGVLLFLGILITVKSLTLSTTALEGEGYKEPAIDEGPKSYTDRLVRALIFVVGSLVFFAVSIQAIGLVLAVAGLVFIASYADPRLGWLTTITIAAVMATLAVAIFRYGIGLPLPVWP